MNALVPAISFGVAEGALIVGVVLLLFGARKIPQLAKGIGTGIRNFKGELTEGEGPPEEDEYRRE